MPSNFIDISCPNADRALITTFNRLEEITEVLGEIIQALDNARNHLQLLLALLSSFIFPQDHSRGNNGINIEHALCDEVLGHLTWIAPFHVQAIELQNSVKTHIAGLQFSPPLNYMTPPLIRTWSDTLDIVASHLLMQTTAARASHVEATQEVINFSRHLGHLRRVPPETGDDSE